MALSNYIKHHFTCCCFKKVVVEIWVNMVNMTVIYHISLVIRQFNFSYQNNPKNLDPSYKMDLDFLDCLGEAPWPSG